MRRTRSTEFWVLYTIATALGWQALALAATCALMFDPVGPTLFGQTSWLVLVVLFLQGTTAIAVSAVLLARGLESRRGSSLLTALFGTATVLHLLPTVSLLLFSYNLRFGVRRVWPLPLNPLLFYVLMFGAYAALFLYSLRRKR